MREALTTIVRLDERELTEQSRGKWPLDDKLIDAWRQIDALFVEAFGLAANPREMFKRISKSTVIDKRSISFFTQAGWLDGKDYHTVDSLKFYINLINSVRPTWLRLAKMGKTVSRDHTQPSTRAIQGSVLRSPPLPVDGQEYLEALVVRSEGVVGKMHNVIKRLKRPADLEQFHRILDPDNTLRADPKEPKIRIPDGARGVFQPIMA